ILVLARDLEVLDGLGKFARSRLDFLEEARILDRDDRLVGKRLEKLDLLLCEGPHFESPEQYRADCLRCSQEWYAQARTPPQPQRGLAIFGVILSLGPHVSDLDRASLHDGPTDDEATHKGNSELSNWVGRGNLSIMCDEA